MKWIYINKKWVIIGVVLFVVFLGWQWTNEKPDYPAELATLDLPEKVDFNYHIRPILSNNCYVCHGPDESSREAGLRLDNSEDATSILASGGAAIIPGDPDNSLLIKRVVSHDSDYQMPPAESKKTLTNQEIGLLKKWIEQGAKWKPYWAFIPPEKPAIPSSESDWSEAETIDYLINKEINQKHLIPTNKADKNTLIRRVAYLLTGLPPKPSEIELFLADDSDQAYEKMVTAYLESPHFGERWARHWMDLMRYGESMGHEGDFNISGTWQYRDYLIRAFNQDVPYDLFVKEHLAGDILENPRYNPSDGFNESSLGTAYFFLGEGKHSPVNIKQEEADKIDNVIDVTSKTFQAMTVSCARCHDHKFDPIPTKDYYAMYGMIESSRISPLPARRTKKQVAQFAKLKTLKQTIHQQIMEEWKANNAALSATAIKAQASFINQITTEAESKKEQSNSVVLGDFRNGDWGDWMPNGWAFGEAPLKGEPIIKPDNYTIAELSEGFASSRVFGTGIQGALRSPNFIIEHDSIVVNARGNFSDIRIIIENFQTIRGPLYQDMEKRVEDIAWKDYVLDVSLNKGRKAYLEFLPGSYREHLYQIKRESFIDIRYAISYEGTRPKLVESDLNIASLSTTTAIQNWLNGQATLEDIQVINNYLKKAPRSLSTNLKGLQKEYNEIAAELYDTTHVLGMNEGDPVFSPVFNRGSISNLSEEKVPRQFLTMIDAGPKPYPQAGSGRLAWAESVVDPTNPLTARVMVNRIWHHLFGRGIVETVDNFGLQGKLPSHPELLDYLALQFMEDDWSMKSMIKNILLSQTFQRATQVNPSNVDIDPDNIFLHHFPIRRLEAEAIRDGMLAATGSLDPKLYGDPIPVYLNEFMTGRGRPRHSGPLDGAGRRSIYTTVRRNFLPPFMLAFDMPIPFSAFGKRNTTNVPAQSLTLLNDPFVHEQAKKWGERLVQHPETSIENRLQHIYLHAFAREATETELNKAKTFLENQAIQRNSTLEQLKNDAQLWADYCHTIFNFKEFVHLI